MMDFTVKGFNVFARRAADFNGSWLPIGQIEASLLNQHAALHCGTHASGSSVSEPTEEPTIRHEKPKF
jgi:hypothetical protein